MSTKQLEFNFDNASENDCKFALMQKQLDEMEESIGKVRRKLFAEMGELKKLYQEMKVENEDLKKKLTEPKNEKTQWIYGQEGYLFSMRECQAAC